MSSPRSLPRLGLLLASALLAMGAPVFADVTVRFAHQHPTRWGESVYLLGDHPELGGGDPRRALRMVPGAGDEWTLRVELPEGASYRYVYLVRWNEPRTLADPANARVISTLQQGVAPGAPRLRRVRVRYLSGFHQVSLRYRASATEEREVALARTDAGRGPGEWLWTGEVTTTLPELEFVLHDGRGGADAPAGEARYRTGYGAFSLAEGRIHPGEPGLDVLGGPANGRVVRVAGWWSHRLGNARDVFVYLPRGYDQRPDRRYPVLYMHDGQNLFGAGGPFGSWRVGEALDRGIAAGRIEELIVVGVGNTPARMSEYVPDEDGGRASDYGRFLSEELIPWVDGTLRTRPGAQHRAVAGSSLGGICSLYLGWRRPDLFGHAASLSGSYWLRRWIEDVLDPAPRQPLRIWLDSGTEGSTGDGAEGTLWVRDALLRKGYALGDGLDHMVDLGAAHDEASWRGRVGRVLEYLFPAGSVSGRDAP